ncbi:hypothetical protein MA5S0422_2946 [Mycobacteroides abscessus 5S-0422]|uniref:Uncharacterized protein n=1 Tax=Mycobacteroides abscessus subsp. bolletii 1513 TaxID=1299321 RepID=X8DV86_9MYCO|nr:hypothetical protein MA5S0304_2011 [Mycobacteroides abscessus 5S-0304]EIU12849.1 hypothetical protein MA5S0421_2264 [Mycobacteroides abscessus 5S-0421]EIU13070.1 hypothetical protein MA5S0422_2946 [Mycobacteroides abscessus 5S-0422]EIU21476.1 hypothetical protein MA5S0708_5032 [Mycobacteroides abscessus 5S-0708]EIU24869.1 hypothetical protein MA5S0817_5021 [Mycobacteroides abscessus 5S-0817]EIU29808.1 hypothetical protein MA5S1212_4407 [Mycobacteroides abscessus 5S-1212]EIU42732.1 hypothet
MSHYQHVSIATLGIMHVMCMHAQTRAHIQAIAFNQRQDGE